MIPSPLEKILRCTKNCNIIRSKYPALKIYASSFAHFQNRLHMLDNDSTFNKNIKKQKQKMNTEAVIAGLQKSRFIPETSNNFQFTQNEKL